MRFLWYAKDTDEVGVFFLPRGIRNLSLTRFVRRRAERPARLVIELRYIIQKSAHQPVSLPKPAIPSLRSLRIPHGTRRHRRSRCLFSSREAASHQGSSAKNLYGFCGLVRCFFGGEEYLKTTCAYSQMGG